MNLCRNCNAIRGKETKNIVLVCNITEFLIQEELRNYVKEMLEELHIDVNSFYRKTCGYMQLASLVVAWDPVRSRALLGR